MGQELELLGPGTGAGVILGRLGPGTEGIYCFLYRYLLFYSITISAILLSNQNNFSSEWSMETILGKAFSRRTLFAPTSPRADDKAS